jgi:hypothetical protein
MFAGHDRARFDVSVRQPPGESALSVKVDALLPIVGDEFVGVYKNVGAASLSVIH